MTKNERIETLTKLCWDYMEELDKVAEESYKVARKIYDNDPDTSVEQLKLIDRRMKHIREKFILPLQNILRSEGVQLMKMEDEKLKLLMEDKREIIVDVNGSEPLVERFL